MKSAAIRVVLPFAILLPSCAQARTYFNDLTARVNSCPSRFVTKIEFFRSLFGPNRLRR